VYCDAGDDQGHDGDEDEGDKDEHGNRFRSGRISCADVFRLPPPLTHVDRDQP
jgi:hypothetical protein